MIQQLHIWAFILKKWKFIFTLFTLFSIYFHFIFYFIKTIKQMFIAALFKIDQTGNNLVVFQWVSN